MDEYNPYNVLALAMIRQALRDINAYYTQKGKLDDFAGGRDAIHWITHMSGTFRTIASSTFMPLEKFHQLCLHHINLIRDNARS